MDRMVECGACDSRFRINDDVIIRARKFYPGEKTGPQLKRFQRVPLSAAKAPEGMETMRYAEFSHPEQLEPTSPQRIIAGIFGVAVMLFIGLLLLLSSGQGGTFSVMPLQNKLVVAGFVSILGLTLLIYANPKAKVKAALVGLLLSAAVISVPFFVKGSPVVASKGDETVTDPVFRPLFPEEEIDPIDALRQRFGTDPLVKEQQRLETEGGSANAFGVYITGMLERNKYTARDYLTRDTGAALTSHLYPRDDDSYLMILTGVGKSLEEVAEIAGKLGKTEAIHPEIGIVVVSVDNEQFLAGSADKLNDRNDPAFYDLNRRELESIDIDRVERAVDRLADSDATIYRTDITRIMIDLLTKPGVKFHDSLGRALLKWAEDPVPAAEAGLAVLKTYRGKGLVAPENLVALVAKARLPEAIPVIVDLWESNPILWDAHLMAFGSAVEASILGKLDSENPPLRRSAVKILGKVGTAESLPKLRKALGAEDAELRVVARRAIEQIEAR